MNKNKIVVCILIIISIILGFETISFAEDTEFLSRRVKMTNFRYEDASGNPVNTLSEGKTVYAKAELTRTSAGTGSQKYVFATFVYNNNRLIDVVKQEGEVLVGDLISTSLNNEIKLPEVLQNAKLKTLLLEDLINFAPLAEPADFGSNSCEILELYANNTLLNYDYSLKKYTYQIPLLKSYYPIAFEAVTKNAATNVSVENLNGYTGTANIKIASHSGIETASYNVEVISSGIPDGKAIRYGKKGYVNSGVISTNDFPTTNLFYLSRTTGAFGGCQVGFFEFELPEVPEDADFEATLELYTYSNNEEHKLLFYDCTDEEWNTKDYVKNEMPYFDDKNPVSDVSAICPVSANGTYSKCEIPLKTEFLKGKQTIVIAIRPEFGTLNGYAFIDLKTNCPVIKYTVNQ